MGVVYFIQGETTKLIKIGRCESADNITERLTALQTGSPDKLSIIGIIGETLEVDENCLHGIFAHLWSHGEWFRPDSVLLDFIHKFADTRTLPRKAIWPKHRKMQSAIKNFRFQSSAALRAYVKGKVSEKDNVPN